MIHNYVSWLENYPDLLVQDVICHNGQFWNNNILTLIRTLHRYSVDIFSYSGPSGILESDGKKKNAKAGARGMRIVALSISSHEQTR